MDEVQFLDTMLHVRIGHRSKMIDWQLKSAGLGAFTFRRFFIVEEGRNRNGPDSVLH